MSTFKEMAARRGVPDAEFIRPYLIFGQIGTHPPVPLMVEDLEATTPAQLQRALERATKGRAEVTPYTKFFAIKVDAEVRVPVSAPPRAPRAVLAKLPVGGYFHDGSREYQRQDERTVLGTNPPEAWDIPMEKP